MFAERKFIFASQKLPIRLNQQKPFNGSFLFPDTSHLLNALVERMARIAFVLSYLLLELLDKVYFYNVRYIPNTQGKRELDSAGFKPRPLA